MSSMLKSSGNVALATLISRILGLLREMAFAAMMGNGLVASAFSYAFAIPNLFRRLLGEGALTAAFIPYFKETEKREGEAAMWRCANAVICALVVTTAILVLVVFTVGTVVVSGNWFSGKTSLMLDLLRWMAPYMPLVCVAAVCMGMLNARGSFFIPALGPALLNVVMIASVFWLSPLFGDTLEKQVFGLAAGVVIAGLVQCAFQFPGLRKLGYRFHWVNPWQDPSVRHVAHQMIPGALGVAAFQLNVILTTGFGYWVGDHVVASFGFAVRLMEFPQGLFGVSMAVYLLPTLSSMATDKRFDDFRETLARGLGYVYFTNIIAASLLVSLATPIVRLLFERNRFDATATSHVVQALLMLAPGLLAFSSVNILARAFYALKDTRTPTRISIFCLLLNLAITAVLVRPMEQAGMALANTITSFLNMALLTFALKKKLHHLAFKKLWASLPVNLFVGALAGFFAFYLTNQWQAHLGSTGFWTRIGAVFVPALGAGGVYAAIVQLAQIGYGSDAIQEFYQTLRRKIK